MKGTINILWDKPVNLNLLKEIIVEEFQNKAELIKFVRSNLVDSTAINHLIKATTEEWTFESFKALYILCWIFSPSEKKTYTVQISSDAKNLEEYFKNNLIGEKGSLHIEFKFLNGSKELIVEIEKLTENKTHLKLKCEGNVPVINRLIPNLADPTYKALKKALKLNAKETKVRRILPVLFNRIQFYPSTDISGMTDVHLAMHLGNCISNFSNQKKIKELSNDPTIINELRGIMNDLSSGKNPNIETEKEINKFLIDTRSIDSSFTNFCQINLAD